MRSSLLRSYHALPPRLRSVPASLWGIRLRRWRYGAETDALVEEAMRRETWSHAEWSAWREERLAALLHRAATRVPYYRQEWERRRRSGDRSSAELLGNWPILKKEALRRNARAFVADDCDPGSMYREHTSGTTGTPLELWWSRKTVRQWYALFEARVRGWNGVSRKDRWAILGGQLVAPASQRQPPFWVWNAGLHQLYMSSYHLTPETAPAYLGALERYAVPYLIGYPSAFGFLAKVALERGLKAPALRVIIGNAEPLLDDQRAAAAAVFQCPVRDTYGMAEAVAAGSECASGRLHAWPEVGNVEIRDDASDDPAGEGAGRIVTTGLLNGDMPLIRYDVGDRGRLEPNAADELCGCGRRLPVWLRIEGRADDLVVTPDGRRIGRFDPVFKADLPIREAQIVQESVDRLRVRVVPAGEFTASASRDLLKRIRERVGSGMEILVETVSEIPRTSSGKFRAVISLLPPAERIPDRS